MSADAATRMPGVPGPWNATQRTDDKPVDELLVARERGLWQPARYIGHIRALVHGWNRRHRDGGAPTIHDFGGFPHPLFEI